MFGTNHHRARVEVVVRSTPRIANMRTKWQHARLLLADSLLAGLLRAIVWSSAIADGARRVRLLIVRGYKAK